MTLIGWLHLVAFIALVGCTFFLTLAKVALALADQHPQWEWGRQRGLIVSPLAGVRCSLVIMLVVAGVYGGYYLHEPLAALLRQVPFFREPSGEFAGTTAVADEAAFALLVLGSSFIVLLFGECMPRSLATAYPRQISRFTTPIARGLTRAIYPLLTLTDRVVAGMLPRGVKRAPEEAALSEDRIRDMLRQGITAGAILPAEQQIMRKVFRFGGKPASALMTPRNDIVWLNSNEPLRALWEVVRSSGFSHFPVGRGSIDEPIGIASIRDISEQLVSGAELIDISGIREVYRVPKSMTALKVLERFKQDKKRLALVIDEYGGIDGLVSTHDLMEALVGEMADGEAEYDPLVVRRDDGSFLIDASIELEEMIDCIGVTLSFPKERKGYYSLGGLVMGQLGHVPAPGESFSFRGLQFEVVDMDGYRIDKVLVRVGMETSSR